MNYRKELKKLTTAIPIHLMATEDVVQDMMMMTTTTMMTMTMTSTTMIIMTMETCSGTCSKKVKSTRRRRTKVESHSFSSVITLSIYDCDFLFSSCA